MLPMLPLNSNVLQVDVQVPSEASTKRPASSSVIAAVSVNAPTQISIDNLSLHLSLRRSILQK